MCVFLFLGFVIGVVFFVVCVLFCALLLCVLCCLCCGVWFVRVVVASLVVVVGCCLCGEFGLWFCLLLFVLIFGNCVWGCCRCCWGVVLFVLLFVLFSVRLIFVICFCNVFGMCSHFSLAFLMCSMCVPTSPWVFLCLRCGFLFPCVFPNSF